MKTIVAGWLLAISVITQSSVNAEGLLYQLPKDGHWAEFTIDGVATNDTKDTLVGTIRLSSVGKLQADGETCRWIELRTEAKRNDEKFTHTIKMLIPEKNLARGQEPLKHVIRSWHHHSDVPGGPHMVDHKGGSKESLADSIYAISFHKPFENPQKLEKTLVESKLGKLECAGVKATETRKGVKHTYEIRLHDKAPFGVVTHLLIQEIQENGETAVITTKLTLSNFGNDAVSALPDSK